MSPEHPSPDFNGGLPKSSLDFSYDNLGALQARYGNFAISVLIELRQNNPDFPQDILTVGDNWHQLSSWRDLPENEHEALLAAVGFSIFGNMWPIEIRDKDVAARHLLETLGEGVQVGTLDPRIQTQVAILDRTTIFGSPFFDESEEVEFVEEYPWGRVLRIKGFQTKIYHITSGYTRKEAQDLIGGPGDETSATILRNE